MSSDLPSCCKIVACISFFLLVSTINVFAVTPSDSVRLKDLQPIKSVLIRHEIVQQAKQYLGLSYRYGGKSPKTGFDCSGFTSYIMSRFQVSLSPCSRTQATQGRNINLKDARPGDIIAFRRSRSRSVSHVAMVVENSEEGIFIIHSSTSRGIVIDNLLESSYWRPKIYLTRDILSDQIDKVVPPLVDEKETDDSSESPEAAETRDALNALITVSRLWRW